MFLAMAAAPAGANAQNVTREYATNALAAAESAISEVSDAGFKTTLLNDTLTSAYAALERADFAEALRNGVTGPIAQEAKKALEGLNYQGFGYPDVVAYTDSIFRTKDRLFNVSDSIKALEFKIAGYAENGVDVSGAVAIKNNASYEFGMERYDDAGALVSDANSLLEAKRAEMGTLSAITESGRGVLERNWKEIIAVVVAAVVVVWVWWKMTMKSRLKKKIHGLKCEQEAITSLMKRAQAERYKDHSLSEFMFNIRMERYSQRQNRIREELPVLESMLRKKKPKS
jgi:hypothetical protein